MIKTSLKRVFCFLLLSQMASINSVLADTANTLKTLHDMRITSYAILGDYYMFSGLEGDSRYSRDINTGINAFEKSLTEITKDLRKEKELATIVSHWQSYKTLVETNRNDFLSQGYASARLVGQLGDDVTQLNISIVKAYKAIESAQALPMSEWIQITRDMSLIISTLTAEYSARGTSSMGQIMAIKINDQGMEHQAKLFGNHLDTLKKAPGQDVSIAKSIDQVGGKWLFIAKSIANYNENSVPFIVNSYGDRISKNLQTIGLYYAKQPSAAQ